MIAEKKDTVDRDYRNTLKKNTLTENHTTWNRKFSLDDDDEIRIFISKILDNNFNYSKHQKL